MEPGEETKAPPGFPTALNLNTELQSALKHLDNLTKQAPLIEKVVGACEEISEKETEHVESTVPTRKVTKKQEKVQETANEETPVVEKQTASKAVQALPNGSMLRVS